MLRFPKFGAGRPDPVPQPPPVDQGPAGATVVLLVDDEQAVRNLFGLALSREGYHVVEASNGIEALAMAEQLPNLDLVITDVVMPVMKGPQFADKLRERLPEMKFIFVSGYMVSEELGPNAHLLAKPFMRHDLVDKVREVVGPARPVQEN